MKKIIFVGWSSDYDQIMVDKINGDYEAHSILLPMILRIVFKVVNKFFGRKVSLLITNLYVNKRLRVFDSNSLIVCKDSNFFGYIDAVDKYSNKILIVRNTVDSIFIERYRCGFKNIFSFDEQQCRLFGMNYLPQVIPMTSSEREGFIWQGDFSSCYFLGYDKGRFNKLSSISSALNIAKVKTNLLIVRDSTTTIENFPNTVQSGLTYNQYFKQSLNFGVLLDVNKVGQYGVTMRVIESAYRNCKLITNNAAVRKLPFYSPNNILIIEEHERLDSNKLTEFIESPVDKIDVQLIEKYLVEGFVKGFTS